MPRQPSGRPTIYLGKDGLYHCWPTIGTYPNGRPQRRHIKREKRQQVLEALEEIQARLKQGSGRLAKIETLEHWLAHWIHVVLAAKRDNGTLAWNTFTDYEGICRNHLIPQIGQWRITGTKRRLEPEHVEAMYVALGAKPPRGKGLAPSYVVRIHRVLCIALKLAYKRGRGDRNVMDLVEAPEFRARKVSALSQAEATAVLAEALRDPMAARWVLGILVGPRQGEVLGMRWRNVHLDPDPPEVPNVKLEDQIQRRTWRHGCDDPVACAVGHCRTKSCEPRYAHGCDERTCDRKLARYCPQRRRVAGCYRHVANDGSAKPCPPLCRLGCTGHAKACPRKVGGGLVAQPLKTHASEEPVALGATVTELLRRHRERQIKGGVFDPEGYVFADRRGGALDPRRDYAGWCDLLARAKVKHHPLHAARHTTGTFLRATGSDLKMIQEVLRHADLTMSGQYVEVAMEARRDAVDRVASALMEGDLSKIMGAKKVA